MENGILPKDNAVTPLSWLPSMTLLPTSFLPQQEIWQFRPICQEPGEILVEER